jgi:hypothetical protein
VSESVEALTEKVRLVGLTHEEQAALDEILARLAEADKDTQRWKEMYDVERRDREAAEANCDMWKALYGEIGAQFARYRDALEAICQANDAGPHIEIYRAAGGGYEGLQAIAEAALDPERP